MSKIMGFILGREEHPAFQRGWEMFTDGKPRPHANEDRTSQIAEIEIYGWDRAQQEELSQ